MAGRGTGVPIAFGCAKCRLSRTGWHLDRATISPVFRTGKVRPVPKARRNNGPPRTMREEHQYECKVCGHVGWTRHVDVLKAPMKPSEGS